MADENNQINSLKELMFTLNEKDKEHPKSLIRNSFIEKILTKFIFQYKSTEYGLYNILNYFKEQSENNEASIDNIFSSVKDFLRESSKQTVHSDVLKFYDLLIKAIVESPNKYQSSSNQDFNPDYAIKIEELLKDHLEVNLFRLNKQNNESKKDDYYFNENFIKKDDKINYDYSICSLSTLFIIMKNLEIQNLACNDSDVLFLYEGIITEKKYAVYCKTVKKQHYNHRNFVDYFITENLNAITQELFADKEKLSYNNYEIENKIVFSLWVIKKLIKDYSFYFSKTELESIFLQVKRYKDFPLPIGSMGMELFEVLLQELYYQGITILNNIRRKYCIDSINPVKSSLIPMYFNYNIIIHHEEDPKSDLHKLMKLFDQDKQNKAQSEFLLRDYMIKIFLTTVRNVNFPVNNQMLENIIKKFTAQSKKQVKEEDDEDDVSKSSEDEQAKAQRKLRNVNDNTNVCIRKLLRIIDVGLEKNYDSFVEDISNIADPLLQLTESFHIGSSLKNTPITEFRNFLIPSYETKLRVVADGDENNMNENEKFNLYTSYFKAFEVYYKENFDHLDDTEHDTKDKIVEKKRKRLNILNDFKLPLIIIEDKKTIYGLLDQIKALETVLETIENHEDWSFWKRFVNNKHQIYIKYIVYVLPCIYENNLSHLSDFIANNDYIYQTVVFNPWSAKNHVDEQTVDKIVSDFQNYKFDFKFPEEYDIYSFLKDPLDIYMSDAESVFDLHLYKLSNKSYEKLFWKSVDINFNPNNRVKDKKSDYVYSVVSLNMTCVDLLGVEYHDTKVNLKLKDPERLKIFNVFNKKDAPLNYNMSSNNGWLEIFLLERADTKILEKEKKEAKNHSSYSNYSNYYQKELVDIFVEFDSKYRNFKVSKIEIVSELDFKYCIDEREFEECKLW